MFRPQTGVSEPFHADYSPFLQRLYSSQAMDLRISSPRWTVQDHPEDLILNYLHLLMVTLCAALPDLQAIFYCGEDNLLVDGKLISKGKSGLSLDEWVQRSY